MYTYNYKCIHTTINYFIIYSLFVEINLMKIDFYYCKPKYALYEIMSNYKNKKNKLIALDCQIKNPMLLYSSSSLVLCFTLSLFCDKETAKKVRLWGISLRNCLIKFMGYRFSWDSIHLFPFFCSQDCAAVFV